MPGGTNKFETSYLRLLQDAMLHNSGKPQYPQNRYFKMQVLR